ncbi:MAG TPA: hypothetical protein VM513_20610 [Kofleriaceae bacterium]|jgi:hypothetical protein|nr:hypothetical protein [Kofleriaceae bacterium]
MPRLELVADCDACAALCCVWLAFDESPAFAFSKPAGLPCRYITSDCRCAIHAKLARRGFAGCAAYDCHGAGQRATALFARAGALSDREKQDAFATLRELHELLWVLDGAARLCDDDELRAELAAVISALDAIASSSIDMVLDADLRSHRAAARALLRRVRARG